jgi:hypothetical protein
LLDGFNSAVANTGNTVAIRNADGNLSANYFVGNGAFLTGIDTSLIANGNSNVSVAANGNVTVSVAGNAGVAVFTGTGVNVAGTLNATANVTGANLVTAGNVYAENLVNITGNTSIAMGNGSGIVAIYSAGNATQFGPSGTVTLGGASQIIGGTFGGSGLTLGASQTDIFQNRGGNVTVQVGTGGTIANTWTFAQDGSFTSPGNINGANANLGGTLGVTGNANVGNLGTGGLITATGNVTGGNLITGGAVVATGNVSSGNLSTGGTLGVTGNANVGN